MPTQREGAIWAPGGVAIDDDGNLWVATANGSSTDQFDYGSAVIKLSPDLQVLDWFAPTDWATLNDRDLDLGTLAPTLLDGGLVFQVGKDGVGYLLKADHLGGIGGQLFSAPVCSEAQGATAYAPPNIYVSCEDGIVALQVTDEPGFSVIWRGPETPRTLANPPIVVGDSVWAIDRIYGSLYALAANDGSLQFRSSPAPTSPPPHFVTPSVAQDRIVTVWGKGIAAFGP